MFFGISRRYNLPVQVPDIRRGLRWTSPHRKQWIVDFHARCASNTSSSSRVDSREGIIYRVKGEREEEGKSVRSPRTERDVLSRSRHNGLCLQKFWNAESSRTTTYFPSRLQSGSSKGAGETSRMRERERKMDREREKGRREIRAKVYPRTRGASLKSGRAKGNARKHAGKRSRPFYIMRRVPAARELQRGK